MHVYILKKKVSVHEAFQDALMYLDESEVTEIVNPKTLKEVKDTLETFLGLAEDVINTLPSKGLTGSECQKTFLINKLNEVFQAVNGLEESDLK